MENFEEKKRKEIAFAQSFNLAVALIAPSIPDDTQPYDPDVINKIENWQKYFFAKLMALYQPQ